MSSTGAGRMVAAGILLLFVQVTVAQATSATPANRPTITVPARDDITVEVSLNGHTPVPLIFDTGSLNILSTAFANEIGLAIDTTPETFGAGGGPIAAHRTHVDILRIGGLTLHDLTFHIIDVPPGNPGDPVGALGYEVLQRLAVKFDYQKQRLTFYTDPAFMYTGSGTAVPLHMMGQYLEVEGALGDTKGLFLIDTGNQTSFTLTSSFVAANDLKHRLDAHFCGYSGSGYGGPTPDACFVRVSSFRVGNAEVHSVIAALAVGDPGPGEISGNIGRSILRQFNITFDVPHSMMYLEKNPSWGKPGIFNRAGLILNPRRWRPADHDRSSA